MKTISIPRQSTNITALDEALELALADNYLGISIHDGTVRVHLTDETPSEEVQQAGQLAQNHDPAQLTPEQQTNLLKRQNLLQARSENPALLDRTNYDSSDVLIKQLAYKLHWLEQEIRDLRDL